MLSSYVIDWSLRKALQDVPGMQVISTVSITDLTYAADIALLGESFKAVQEALEGVERYSAALSLRINALKTKVLHAQVAASQQGQLLLE